MSRRSSAAANVTDGLDLAGPTMVIAGLPASTSVRSFAIAGRRVKRQTVQASPNDNARFSMCAAHGADSSEGLASRSLVEDFGSLVLTDVTSTVVTVVSTPFPEASPNSSSV